MTVPLWLKQNGSAKMMIDGSQKTAKNLQNQTEEGLFKVTGLKFQSSVFTEGGLIQL